MGEQNPPNKYRKTLPWKQMFLKHDPPGRGPTSYPHGGGLTSLDAAESGDVEMTMVEAQERFVLLFFWGGVFLF